jgi:CDP-diacylglycerol--serine O-phosphatidyltransferase
MDEETRKRGIYILPNLFTTASLFAGFYAVVAAMKDMFESAAIAIFIAAIMDTLDGRVARLTHSQSDFGAEYDSLSDIVAFGVAPALVVYSWTLSGLGKLGWLIAFTFTACGALRLARFNVQREVQDPHYFRGLPIPAGAMLLAALVWSGTDLEITIKNYAWILGAVTFCTGLLMVSNIPYYSFKGFDVRGRVPFIAILAMIFIFVTVAVDPPKILAMLTVGFALSGPVTTAFRWWRRRVAK